MTGLPERLKTSRWLPLLIAAVSVSAVVILFAWPTLFSGRTLFHTHDGWPPTDESALHFSLQKEVLRQWNSGESGAFNPYPAFGLGLDSDPNALLFDPVMAVGRGLGPVSRVYSFRAIILGFLASLALFGLLRLLEASAVGSVTGAMVFAALVFRYPPVEEVLLHYAATDWSVIALFFLAMAVRRKQAMAFPLASVAMGFSALSGHPQGAYYGLALGILYLVGEALGRRGDDRRFVITGGIAWLFVSCLIAATQLVPLAAGIHESGHVFADATHPELDENLPGYILSLLGPGLLVFLLLPLRRRWVEISVLSLLVLFVLTVMNTPLLKVWHLAVPFFSYFKLSSKYFISPFPIIAAVGAGLGVAVASGLKWRLRRVLIPFVCILALWPVWTAPLKQIYELQMPPEAFESFDSACLSDIRDNTPRFGRIVRLGTEIMYPNLASSAGLFDVQAVASHLPDRYADLMTSFNPDREKFIREDSRVMSLTKPEVLELPFWDIAGVTTLVSGAPVEIGGWEPVLARPGANCVLKADGYWIYRNSEALPRAFLVRDANTPDGQFAGLQFVTSATNSVPVLLDGSAKIREYSGSRVEIEVESPEKADLVLSDYWSSDWKAYVNGDATPVRRTWYIFRAVEVPKGNSIVEMMYRPVSTMVGMVLGGAGLLAAVLWTALAAAFAFRRRKNIRRPDAA